MPPILDSIQCFGAFSRFMCFFGPRTILAGGRGAKLKGAAEGEGTRRAAGPDARGCGERQRSGAARRGARGRARARVSDESRRSERAGALEW
jgi:hypothetical protein